MARHGLYQPFIEDRNVRRLYRLKVAYRERTGTKLPMTALVNRILDDFFEGHRVTAAEGGESEPWETSVESVTSTSGSDRLP